MNRSYIHRGAIGGIIFFCLLSFRMSAQQQSLHTMFMFNKLLVNPAYAGYHEHPCITGHIREQWIGFEGAPKTQTLSMHGPLSSQRIGIGFNLQRRSIGVSSATTIDGVYDYRFPIGNGTLSLGVQASARFLEVDYTDPNVRTVQDINIDQGVESVADTKFLANVGAGLYYYTPQFYVGLSAPRLMNSDIDFELNDLFIAREQAHYYLMTGVALRLDHRMSFVPQVMVRYTENAPVDVDLNLGIRWYEDYSLAVTLRKGGVDDRLLESIDLIASAKVLRGLRIGAAYDITMSELRQYSNGSLEVMLMYCFGEEAKPSTFINPRYFLMMSMKFLLSYIIVLGVSILSAQDTTFVCHLEGVDISPLESINSKSIEFSPSYYKNGLVFVVARERNMLLDPKTGQAYFDLMYADLAPDGTTGNPISFSPNIRTQYHEGPCTFSSDGNEIFFTRSNLSGGTGINDAKGQVQLKIYHAIKGAEDWEQVKELPFSSNEYSIAHPTLSHDGKYLVFSSDMPGTFGGMDLFVVERNGDDWLLPVNLGSTINSKGNELFPNWHSNGTLFFSSDGRGGHGGLDIYVTSSENGNAFNGIQHLDFPINSGRDDLGLIVSEDGKSGYFGSDRKPTDGKDDLYLWASSQSIFCTPQVIAPILVSKELLITNESGDPVPQAYVWLIPMNEEGPTMHREFFNTELVPNKEKEGSFYLRWGVTDTLSTESANAVSAINGRVNVDVDNKQTYAVVVQHDQYLPYVTVIPGESLPTYIRLITAPVIPTNCFKTLFSVYNAEGNLVLANAQISLSGPCLVPELKINTNAEGISSTCIPGCAVKAEIQHEGYANHTFTFTPTEDDEHWNVYLKSSKDLTAPTAPIASGTVIVLDNIYYDFNKSAIRSSDAGELKALADILTKYPDLTIELTSHTDTRGTAEYNMELSERRSESSKSYLVILGVNPVRIVTKAAGESMPRNNCTDDVPCTEAEHQYNRRTEVRITNPAQGMEVRYKSNG